MRVIPVLDVRAGVAVHAAGGDRDRYAPLQSVWAPGSSDPRTLCEAYKRKYQFDTPLELYLADLDALRGRSPADLALYRDLSGKGLSLWVDAGARDARDPASWFDAGVSVAVLGLETLAGPEALADAVSRWGAGRLVFSVDLRSGRPMVDTADAWGTLDPAELAGLAWDLGLSRVLLLDLDRVGTGQGAGDLDLLRRVSSRAPTGSELFVGGGVRSPDDLEPLRQSGASGVLVGTALHDGRVEPHDLNDWLPK